LVASYDLQPGNDQMNQALF